MGSSDKGQGQIKITEVQTFPVPFSLGEKKKNITINTNTLSKPSQEQIINQAIKLHLKGNISAATKYYQQLINQGCNDHIVFSNYGAILKDLGNLKEAELFSRKAIKIKPNLAELHYNLGSILKNLGNLQEAEVSTRKAIEIKPDLAEANYNLGNILRDLGKSQEARLCSEQIMSIRSWSIIGSQSFNYEMKLD